MFAAFQSFYNVLLMHVAMFSECDLNYSIFPSIQECLIFLLSFIVLLLTLYHNSYRIVKKRYAVRVE